MRTTSSAERLRNGVHPACVGLNRLFNYCAAMWQVTVRGVGSFVGPQDRGIRLYGNNASDYAQIQLIHEVQPAPGKLIVVAARIRPDHLRSHSFRFGLWTPGNEYGVFFQQDPTAPDPQADPPPMYGRAVIFDSYADTPALFDVTDHLFFDLATVMHGTNMVDFIWERSHPVGETGESEGTWGSVTLAQNIPAVPMRPSFYDEKTGGGFAHLDIRGFVVREKTLRE